jgi:DNA-binding PucR family transcriptional regulator
MLDVVAEHSSLRDGKVAAMLVHHPEHAEQHREALRAYVDCSRNAADAAQRLGIHPNTIRYRL